MTAAHTELTPDEIVAAAVIDGRDPSADLNAWEQRKLASLGADSHPAQRHAVSRAADLARGKYKANTERTQRKSQWHEQRALERDRARAERAALLTPDATPTEVLLAIARSGKADARVSACTQLLKQHATGADTSTLAIFCRGYAVSPDAPYADLAEASARLTGAMVHAQDATKHEDTLTIAHGASSLDTRTIALSCLREVIAEAETDQAVVRAAAALLASSSPESALTSTRPIWIARGRYGDVPKLPIVRVRSLGELVPPAAAAAPHAPAVLQTPALRPGA